MTTTETKQPAEPSQGDELGDLENRVDTTIDGRYRLIELIGTGGMGAVYRAEHVTIRRPVAVKLLHPGLAEVPELARRFEREAFAIGRIDHPNCVNVTDFGCLDDGSLYLVMEYLQGESLGDLLEREGALPPIRALRILKYVLRGLGHAHQAGIVHRDVKPENIVLVGSKDDPDVAKVLDFGIAKLVDEAIEEGTEKLTQAGIAFGTPAYISPEQAVGDTVDERADLYSATVVLYECLAGQPPFSATDRLELLAMHAGRPAPSLGEHMGPRAVPELEALVAKGLEKRRENRYASADDYIAAIDSILARMHPPTMRPPTEPGRWPEEFTPRPEIYATAYPAHTQTTSGLQTVTGSGTAATPLPTSGFNTVTGYGEAATASPSSSRKYLYTVGGVAAASVLLLIILLGRGGDTEGSASGASEWMQSGTESSDVSERAEEKLNRGSPDETIDLLQAQGDEIQGDADAQLQLGHAHAHKSEYDQALEAYRRALELDGSLIANATLRTNLDLMIDDDGPIYIDAAKLLIAHGADDRGKTRLLEIAAGKNATARTEAFELAESIGLSDQIDRVASFTWDLKQGKTCEDRKAAVAKLRALGDKSAIGALQNARTRRSGRRWKRRNANACLKTAAEDAIKYLKSLPDEPE